MSPRSFNLLCIHHSRAAPDGPKIIIERFMSRRPMTQTNPLVLYEQILFPRHSSVLAISTLPLARHTTRLLLIQRGAASAGSPSLFFFCHWVAALSDYTLSASFLARQTESRSSEAHHCMVLVHLWWPTHDAAHRTHVERGAMGIREDRESAANGPAVRPVVRSSFSRRIMQYQKSYHTCVYHLVHCVEVMICLTVCIASLATRVILRSCLVLLRRRSCCIWPVDTIEPLKSTDCCSGNWLCQNGKRIATALGQDLNNT